MGVPPVPGYPDDVGLVPHRQAGRVEDLFPPMTTSSSSTFPASEEARCSLTPDHSERDEDESRHVEDDTNTLQEIPAPAEPPPLLGIATFFVPAKDAHVEWHVPDEGDREHRGKAHSGGERQPAELPLRTPAATKQAATVAVMRNGSMLAKRR